MPDKPPGTEQIHRRGSRIRPWGSVPPKGAGRPRSPGKNRWNLVHELRKKLEREAGASLGSGGRRLALFYPGTYRAGMSSLGFQWIANLLAAAGFAVERAFLPDRGRAGLDGPILTLESRTALGDFPLVAVSIAWELEMGDLVAALLGSGIAPLREQRSPRQPSLLIGGPLTFSNPLPVAPLADAMLIGEADHTVVRAVESFFQEPRGSWLLVVESLAGGYVPELHGHELPVPAIAPEGSPPAVSRILSPNAALANMFLVEAVRGCSRHCSFCVMGGRRLPGMRVFSKEQILSAIPPAAPRVGLVGAGVSDHPELEPLLRSLLERGKGVGISSLRADQVARNPELAVLLGRAGYRTLTVAADAASQRLRAALHKGITEEHLLACAGAAASNRFRVLKLYVMLGVPGETDDDVRELAVLLRQLSSIHPVALAVSPFVPKWGTPMQESPFAGQGVLNRRLRILDDLLAGHVDIRSTSPRWAWVEAELARGGWSTGEAVVRAISRGGNFAAWKRELSRTPGPA